MFQRQGLYNEAITGMPIADGSKLIPFISHPVLNIEGATITGWLKSICGNWTAGLGELDVIIKNETLTVVWTYGKDSGVNMPMGYYYIDCIATTPAGQVIPIYNAYVDRVLADDDKAVIEAEQCTLDALSKLAGGDNVFGLLKTEPFFIPDESQLAPTIGSFNQSFNESFNV